jgi:NAD(P)-dependent dehydrogenase (short-subunit alcohol dehydrogenase family)
MQRLESQVALVTGGGSGLGRAVVERFVAEGARVGVLDRSEEKLEKLVADLGDQVTTVVGDVTDPAANQRAVDRTVEAFGGLDTFVGNAGIWDYFAPLVELTPEAVVAGFDELFAVNVKGYLLGVKAAIPALLERRGSVILTGSNASFLPAGGGALYTASKHAVVGLVRQLAYELAPKVRVNGVAPGGMATDLRGPASLQMDGQAIGQIEGVDELIRSTNPLQQAPRPEDYTGHYVTLAARDESSTTTGAMIVCDNGLGVRGLTQAAGGLDL